MFKCSKAFIFSGSEAQIQKIGADMFTYSCETHPFKVCWEHIEYHCQDKYGFSLSSIMKDNPQTVSVCLSDKIVRSNYQSMVDGDDMPIYSQCYDYNIDKIEFKHHKGVLLLPSIRQLAIIALESCYAYMIYKFKLMGDNDKVFGCSLGELGAILNFCDLSSLELWVPSILNVAFFRGSIMVHETNKLGKIFYSATFVTENVRCLNDKFLEILFDEISKASNSTLQIASYTLKDNKYMIIGESLSLKIFESCCLYLKSVNYFDVENIIKYIDDILKNTNSEDNKLDPMFFKITGKGCPPYHTTYMKSINTAYQRELEKFFGIIQIDMHRMDRNLYLNINGATVDLNNLKQICNTIQSSYMESTSSLQYLILALVYNSCMPCRIYTVFNDIVHKGIQVVIEVAGFGHILKSFSILAEYNNKCITLEQLDLKMLG